mmetsp:Transcript_17336/g.39073  ORF Transcript_17336/g.39073 Transcript_17336/m.39073 type:complete len:220 (-) Transcript_17336:354-1013(-)
MTALAPGPVRSSLSCGSLSCMNNPLPRAWEPTTFDNRKSVPSSVMHPGFAVEEDFFLAPLVMARLAGPSLMYAAMFLPSRGTFLNSLRIWMLFFARNAFFALVDKPLIFFLPFLTSFQRLPPRVWTSVLSLVNTMLSRVNACAHPICSCSFSFCSSDFFALLPFFAPVSLGLSASLSSASSVVSTSRHKRQIKEPLTGGFSSSMRCSLFVWSSLFLQSP